MIYKTLGLFQKLSVAHLEDVLLTGISVCEELSNIQGIWKILQVGYPKGFYFRKWGEGA